MFAVCLSADDPESFGSSATAEGFTAVSSTAPGASTTSGTASTTAGEKALRTLPRDDIFLDGAAGLANIVQRAIGEHLPAPWALLSVCGARSLCAVFVVCVGVWVPCAGLTGVSY